MPTLLLALGLLAALGAGLLAGHAAERGTPPTASPAAVLCP